MLYHLKYVVYEDKKLAAQELFKNMTQEERDAEFPEGVTKIARVHNSASGYGYVIVDAESHEKLHGFMMSWAPMCTFPQVEAMIDDEDLLEATKSVIYNLELDERFYHKKNITDEHYSECVDKLVDSM